MSHREVKFTKDGIEYTAQIWLLDPSVEYRSRIVLIHNPGESVELYQRFIKAITQRGFEVFFYKLSGVYENEDRLRRELNRILKMAIDDLDKNPHYKIHSLHLMGSFIAGLKILDYGISGYYRHRVRSVISISPLLSPKHGSLFKKHIYTHLTNKVKFQISTPTHRLLDIKIQPDQITSDGRIVELIESQDLPISTISSIEFNKLISIIHSFKSKRFIHQNTIRNILIIHSAEDPFSHWEKSEYLLNNSSAEAVGFLKYEHGKSNLILEVDSIFQRLLNDLMTWFDEL